MQLFIAICIFIIVALAFQIIALVFRIRANPEVKRVRKMLRALSAEAYRNEIVSIVKKRSLSTIPWLDRRLLSMQAHVPLMQRIDLFLQQADVVPPLSVFVLLSVVMGVTGYLSSLKLIRNNILALIIGLLLATVPFFLISLKRKSRMRKFERQFPDALEMIARALRAGHAFLGGMRMVAEEFDDPIGGEFKTTVDQINFGVSFQNALKSLAKRIDCPDLKFFTISIIIQKKSGGNLAEILENISMLIRDRFKLRSHIRALSAEGKLSAIILVALPFMIALALSLTSPEYIKVLVTEPVGKKLIAISIFMMFIGIMVMKKIISIKV
ncbi:type II secretion system F family protein [bacterium]|nr:type II secretion system F family protein [bacterium]